MARNNFSSPVRTGWELLGRVGQEIILQQYAVALFCFHFAMLSRDRQSRSR